MRFHITLAAAAALALSSTVSAMAGSLATPQVENDVFVTTEAPASSIGSLGGSGALIGVLLLVGLAAAASGSSSSGTSNN